MKFRSFNSRSGRRFKRRPFSDEQSIILSRSLKLFAPVRRESIENYI